MSEDKVYLKYKNLEITVYEERIVVHYLDTQIVSEYDYEYFFKRKWSTPFKIVRSIIFYKGWGKDVIKKIKEKKIVPIEHKEIIKYECQQCFKIHDTYIEAEKCHWYMVHEVKVCSCCNLREEECLNKEPEAIEIVEEETKKEEDFSWLEETSKLNRSQTDKNFFRR